MPDGDYIVEWNVTVSGASNPRLNGAYRVAGTIEDNDSELPDMDAYPVTKIALPATGVSSEYFCHHFGLNQNTNRYMEPAQWRPFGYGANPLFAEAFAHAEVRLLKYTAPSTAPVKLSPTLELEYPKFRTMSVDNLSYKWMQLVCPPLC